MTRLDTVYLYIPSSTCSGAIVFFVCWLHTSLDSDAMRCMNSLQQFIISSRVSLAKTESSLEFVDNRKLEYKTSNKT